MATQGNQPALNFNIALETFFSSGLAQINAGQPDVFYPDNVPSVMLEAVRERFSSLLNTTISTEHRQDQKVIVLKIVGKPVSPAAKAQKAEKIPRPPNAFICYRRVMHSAVKEQNKNVTNNDICRLLGHPSSAG